LRRLSRSITGFMALHALACVVAGGAMAGNDGEEESAGAPPCESARVIGLRAQDISETHAGGPQPPADDARAPGGGRSRAAIYHVMLDCAGEIYLARVTATRGFDPERLGKTVTLKSAPGGKILAHGESGAPFEVTLAPVSRR
jgi:hypothetical protein